MKKSLNRASLNLEDMNIRVGRITIFVREQSLFLAGEGAEDIWERVPKFYVLKGERDEK